jgi:L-amino acid N-acyltransferase YncA
MRELTARSEAAGIWTLQAGIFEENAASLSLHLQHGFRIVGRRERIGRMMYGPRAGQWRDTLLLERRSAVVGAET